MSSCMCCSSFRPRYKRLVDSIFPATSDGGLVRSEMEKLTYYAVSAPEKLDRIGEYLAHRLMRSISRKQNNSVFIAMEALDQLLLACHAQQINSFVESFLMMVGRLLESDNLEFQAVGTNSFIKFSKIEEDTASYHRRYDFFVSKFSAMCHSQLEDLRDRKKIQGHGVRGIHGVVRKTVADNRQVNIWQQQHMDKIIPSLLYVMMQDQTLDETPARRESVIQSKDGNENIGINAEDCLRELLSRASYANLNSALKPMLSHLDSHKLWTPVNNFAIKCFKVFMFAIQPQHTHVVVKMLLDHLDEQNIDDGVLKASMLEVLCAVVVLPLSSPIGPAVQEVFRQLIRHLRLSIDSKKPQEQEAFQTAFIKTIGVLCGVLLDFQKSEAMMFFISKAKEHASKTVIKHDLTGVKLERLLNLLLQSLYRIAENYKSRNLSGMSSSLLDPLVKVSSAATNKNRLIMQRTLIRLLDRENNYNLLKVVNSVADVESLKLSVTEVTAQDMDIVERKVPALLQYVYESSCLPDNTTENYTALFKCASMLCVSLCSPDVIVDVCRVMLALQNKALSKATPDEPDISGTSKTRLLGVMSACMCVLAFTARVTGLVAYVTGVMQPRLKSNSLQMLDPCYTLSQPEGSKIPLPDKIDEHLLFSEKHIQSCFEDLVVYKIDRLVQPFVPTLPEAESIQMRKSFMDADSVRIEIPGPSDDQNDSDQGKITPKMITYNYLKKRFTEPAPTPLEIAETKRKAVEHVMTSTFEQLVAEVQSHTPSNSDLFDLINRVCVSDDNNVTVLPYSLPDECKPGSNNLVFPSICVL